jgi:UDP-N-acetyl-2-amino-2-deoxyglucuronate dehydrogenase
MKNFAMTGAAGFVAQRHLKAIKDTGNHLVAALDPHDSVGILDRFFTDVDFFTEFERFDRHLEMLRRRESEKRIHYLSICSPNHLHDAHIRLALRLDANAVCEKPLVLNPWNLDTLAELEQETHRRIYTVLQLRLHPALVQLREAILKEPAGKKHEVVLTYVTSRGPWYHYSWKGAIDRSGGLATNIGVHFFDLLQWIFGSTVKSDVHWSDKNRMAGHLELKKASVRWYLSIAREDLPQQAVVKENTTFRSITVDGKEIEFSEGFTDLHSRVYEDILAGGGFGIADARPSIELVHDIRTAAPRENKSLCHPYLLKRPGV